jgi:ankyrin repeat protein
VAEGDQRRTWIRVGLGAALVVVAVLVGLAVLDGPERRSGGPDGEDCADSSVELVRDAHAGRVEAVATALDDGADPDASDAHGNTPLACALPVGSTGVVAALLDHGADPDVTDRFGDTAVADAVRFCHDDVLSLLLDAGADPDEAGIQPSPLVQAVDDGRAGAVELLLAAGAEPDPVPQRDVLRGDEEEARCPDPDPAGRVEALVLVLGAGGEPDAVVVRAVHHGAWDVLAPALAAGAAADATVPEGWSVLVCATAEPGEVTPEACGPRSGVTALAGEPDPADPADPDADPRQPSLLVHAAWAGEVEVVRALLAAEVDPDAVGGGGVTALAAAAGAGAEPVVDLLLPRVAIPLPAQAILPSDVARAAGHTALADRLAAAGV